MTPRSESVVRRLHPSTSSPAPWCAAFAAFAALALAACGSGGSDDGTSSSVVGRFLLVVAQDSVALYELPFLRPAGYVAFQTEVRDAVLDPAEDFLFVSAIDGANREISVLELDSVTGELAEVPGSPFAAPVGADTGLAVHPEGGFLYVGGVGVSAFAIASSGALSAVPGSPFAPGSTPAALAFHPSGEFLYAANSTTDDVSAFAVDELDGSLTPLAGSRFSAGDQPSALAITPAGDFLYVANAVSDDVSAFAIGADGALAAVPNSPFGGVDGPLDVRIDATGSFAFTANESGGNAVVFAIDPDDGALTPTPGGSEPTGSLPRSLALDPDGQLVYVLASGAGQVRALAFDAGSGALADVRSVRTRSVPERLLVTSGTTRPSHRPRFAYAARFAGEIEGFAVDPGTGKFQELASSPFPSSGTPRVLAVDPRARFLFAAQDTGGGIDAYEIHPVTGELDPVPGSPFFIGKTFAHLVVEPSGRFLYAAAAELEAFSINQTTGALAPLAGSPYDLMLVGPVDRLDPDPTGRFLLFLGDGAVGTCALDVDTGVPALVGAPLSATGARTILAAPNGRFAYVPSSTQVELARIPIDAATGALISAGTQTTAIDPQPLGAFHHPIGGLIVLPHGTGVISAFLVAESTGTPTVVTGSPFADGEMPQALVFDPSGRWLYALNFAGLISVFEIGSGGGLTPRGPAAFGLSSVPALVVVGRVL